MAKKKSVEERIQRLEDIEEIKQLMSKYSYLLSACRMKDLVDLFSKREDASACCGDWGLFRGAEGISNQFIGTCPEGGLEGFMSVHMMTTHVIEVAEDGKTAKGVWMSPGHETYDKKMAGRVIPTWGWGKYAADFIKEEGKWKIWHYWNFPDFTVEYEKGWASGGKPEFLQAIDIVLELKPDAPSPYPLTLYTPDKKPQFLPAFPEPYETYDVNDDWIGAKMQSSFSTGAPPGGGFPGGKPPSGGPPSGGPPGGASPKKK